MDCSNKGLHQVNITEDCSIFGLDLSHNSLVATPEINGNQLIEWTDLSHYQILVLNTKNIKRLNCNTIKYLDLSYNRLILLSIQGLYDYLASLEVLNLSSNQLAVNNFNICDHIFRHLWVDLRKNKIDIETNPVPCDLQEDC